MSSFKSICRYFCLPFIIPIFILAGCQTRTPTEEAAWKTFTNQECTYEFQYPNEAQVEVMDKNASQVKVHAGTGDPFQVTCSRDYSFGDALYYLDTQAVGKRSIGENTWAEFRLPEGYCDAVGCSPPIYALQMELGGVLYTVTFYSEDMTTELQQEILATFRVSGRP